MKDPFSEYTAPPEDDELYLPPTQRPGGTAPSQIETERIALDDPETRATLESEMIQTFREIMNDKSASNTQRKDAAKEIGELLGKYAKAASTTIVADNVQQNLLDDPTKRKALLDGLKKARSITEGTDSGIKPMEGGKGV